MPKFVLGAGAKQWVDSWETMDRQMDPDSAGYDPVAGITGGGEKACANCNWFVEPNGCVLVRGDISPTGLSNLWMAEQEYTTDPIPVTIVAGEASLTEPPAEQPPLSVGIGANISSVVSGLIAKAKTALGRDEKPGMVWSLKEQADGRLRFLCAPTNCFQDREGDIFPTAAHKEYVEWADNKQFYPELWVWHTPGTRLGQVDWMDVSDGILVESGLIDVGMEDVARGFKDTDGMSHGYIYADTKEGSNLVDKYWAYEISILPRAWAANAGGMFNLTEGEKMFKPEKKAYLKERLGVDDGRVEEFEKATSAFAESMKSLGIAWKDADTEEAAAATEQATMTDQQMIAQLIEGQQQLISAVTAITGVAVEAKSLATAASKSLDDAVADSIQAKVTQLPQGTAASGSKENVIGEAEAKPQLDWFGNIMDRIGTGVGV
jgi:hypothetical protein